MLWAYCIYTAEITIEEIGTNVPFLRQQLCTVYVLGLGLLFPKYYLIFHSEFPKLLLYYSLRVDPLFHKILLTVSQKWPKQTCQKYTLHKSYTIIHKRLKLKLTVGRSSSRVSRHGHSETESELTQLTIYISTADYSLADSVNFCLFLESFLFPVHASQAFYTIV